MGGRRYDKGRRYAEDTKVPASRSRYEIERLLTTCGATGFLAGWSQDQGKHVIQCFIEGRMLRFTVALPDEESAHPLSVEQEERRRWRALLILIKAKLDSIRSGDSTLDNEFLANLVLPDGKTFADWAGPQIENVYSKGKMPLLLPGGRK